MADKYFIKKIDINEPVTTVFGWHEKIGAFERLTPPWMRLKNIHKRGNGIKTGTKVNMDICFANIPFPIEAEHIGYEKNSFFKDRLSGGIFSKWEHTHTFTPILNNNNLSCSHNGSYEHTTLSNIAFSRLEDRIDYALPFHIPDSLHSFIESELYRLFNYRHSVMINDLERHRDFQLSISSNADYKTSLTEQPSANIVKPLTILVSGASGPVGNALIPFLTTGGHKVIKLVRDKNSKKQSSEIDRKEIDTIEWNPYRGELDLDKLKNIIYELQEGREIGKIDVVINLNGYHIGSDRWTDKTKELIVKSRNLSTSLLAEKISQLPKEIRPELFISASATGFYGDCGDSCLDENSCSGSLFISNVCSDWENCAAKVQDCGVRTVFARMGVVLTPAGGALERLLPAFMLGLGTKIGTGKQYMSWISMDDLVYALHHIIIKKSIHGAVNLISPNPVTNQEFTQTLAQVLSRPAPFTLPASLIRIIWGEMGQEVLLASTRAIPEKLVSSGFKFSHPTLEQALRHLIGREKYLR